MVVLDVLSEKIKARVAVLGIESIDINWEHPADLSNGDYSTNIALIASKKVGKNPKEVAQEIVDHQHEFLDKGPEFIHPLKMQQIADRVGVHVTTVSRAVDEKWIQTHRGLFPLKRFFGGGTQTADGEEVAWDTIRIKLQELIDGEDKNDPLSDDALVAALAGDGITLARRTITKYRKQMQIPSSRQRREY